MFYRSEMGVLDTLDRLPFQTAFQWLVLDDDGVAEAIKSAQSILPRLDTTVELVGPLFPDLRWPLHIGVSEEADRLCAPRRDHREKKRSIGSPARKTAKLPASANLAFWTIFTRFSALTDLLRGGFLVARGRLPSTSNTVDIPVSDWWLSNAVLNVGSGDLEVLDGTRWVPRYRSVYIFRRQIEATDLVGMTLLEAFRKFVGQDAGARELAPRVEFQSRVDANWALRGLFWGGQKNSQHWWPLALRDRAVLPDGTTSFEGLFKSAMADRMGQLLRPLIAGEVRSEGLNLNDQKVDIPRLVWGEEEMHLHSGEASLGEWASEGPILSEEGPKVRFRSVELFSTSLGTPISANTKKSKSKGGRDPKYPWEAAFERLVIQLGTEGHPETGAALARMYLDCLQDSGCVDLPSEDQVKKRLKTKHTRLWSRVTGGGQN